MKRSRFRPGEGPRSEVPRTNLLPGAGQHAQAQKRVQQRRWLLAGLGLCLLVLLGLTLLPSL